VFDLRRRRTVSSPFYVTRAQFSRESRARLDQHLCDDTGELAAGFAIYSLADPRDLRATRYVGMTADPRRRLQQHWNTAQVWIPDEKPWWVKAPKLRPLYTWVRELYADERRLPFMLITAWIPTRGEALLAERRQITACLAGQVPLFNVEREILGRQLQLC
jgi:hypothetical protein